jgi:hypothetical protein
MNLRKAFMVGLQQSKLRPPKTGQVDDENVVRFKTYVDGLEKYLSPVFQECTLPSSECITTML